ncbi:MAG: alpha/beta hydrolase [Pseudomonadota bacterium]
MRLTVSGDETFVATAGPEVSDAARTVVLLHGAGMSAAVWAGQLHALADEATAVLAPTLPGHGMPGSTQASAGIPLTSVGAQAAWVATLLDTVGSRRTMLVGHSMGALIALAAAANDGDRVAALAVLGAAARLPVHPALLQAAAAAPERAVEQMLAWAFAPPQAARPPGIALVALARRILRDQGPLVLATDLQACNDCSEVEAALPSIALPTLVLCGARDRMAPAKAGRALAQALSEGEPEIVEGLGHMLPVEAPSLVAQRLAAWRDRTLPV